MVAIADLKGSHPLAAVADEAARALVSVRLGPGSDVRISLPVLYPSGSFVTVRVGGGPSEFVITDDGAAAREADMAGATEFFQRAARETAERSGVRFDGNEIFEIEAPADALAGFMAIIADTSRRAAQLVSERHAERLDRRLKVGLAERLVDVFGHRHVELRPQIAGLSNHPWPFDASARVNGRVVVFTAVTPSAVSVSSAYLKLDDVRRLEDPPQRVAVLTRERAFRADQRLILGRAARIVDASAPDDEFRRVAA